MIGVVRGTEGGSVAKHEGSTVWLWQSRRKRKREEGGEILEGEREKREREKEGQEVVVGQRGGFLARIH